MKKRTLRSVLRFVSFRKGMLMWCDVLAGVSGTDRRHDVDDAMRREKKLGRCVYCKSQSWFFGVLD